MYVEYGSLYLDELANKREDNMVRILKMKGYSVEKVFN